MPEFQPIRSRYQDIANDILAAEARCRVHMPRCSENARTHRVRHSSHELFGLIRLWPVFCFAFGMSEPSDKARPMTLLRLRSIRNRAQDRLLFGRPAESSNPVEGVGFHWFYEGDLFGFVRWRGDGYGTQTWRVLVAKALGAGDTGTRIPGVEPGGELLLHAFGAVRARRALKAIDALSDVHDLDAIASAYWRHLHLCIDANLPPEPYDAAAFDLRRSRA